MNMNQNPALILGLYPHVCIYLLSYSFIALFQIIFLDHDMHSRDGKGKLIECKNIKIMAD